MNKQAALSQLRQSRFFYERGLARQDAERRAKLHQFLDRHQHASQWATSIAALEDAVQHGVSPNDAALCKAMQQCGQRGQLQAAKRVYTDLYRRVGRPRPLAAHVAFMAACADAGNFTEAHAQFRMLKERDVLQHRKNSGHHPVVNDDLTTAYLRAALCASLAQGRGEAAAGTLRVSQQMSETSSTASSTATGDAFSSTSSSGATPDASDSQSQTSAHAQFNGRDDTSTEAREEAKHRGATSSTTLHSSPWQVALEDFLALRRDTEVFRPHNELTPLLLENAVQLACVGRQWELCLAILRGAAAAQALIPPEAYDASIRACYQAQKHHHVVGLMQRMMATRVAPDERSVRLALNSSEEVSFLERRRRALTDASAVAHPTHGWSIALSLFQALERNGFPLYQQSYEAPLRACANAGRWKEALEMLAVMRRDHRPISPPVYATALAARIEAANTRPEVERLLRTATLTDGQQTSVVLYLAALRACMKQGDWKHFAALSREMKDRDIPESYDKMRLLIEAAYLQENYHSVLMRFARFENITQFERRRVVKDQLVRLYEEDFELSPALLQLVLDAYEKMKGHKDPMVEAAYQAALRHKERLDGCQSLAGDHTAPDEWMFSQAAREARAPSEFR